MVTSMPGVPTPCPACQRQFVPAHDPLIKHGAVTVALDPVMVRWRGRYVPLSRGEAHLFASIALKGRATFAEMDAALASIAIEREQRNACLNRIRRKFRDLSAADPFEPIGSTGLRIRRTPDEHGCMSTVIGLHARGNIWGGGRRFG